MTYLARVGRGTEFDLRGADRPAALACMAPTSGLGHRGVGSPTLGGQPPLERRSLHVLARRRCRQTGGLWRQYLPCLLLLLLPPADGGARGSVSNGVGLPAPRLLCCTDESPSTLGSRVLFSHPPVSAAAMPPTPLSPTRLPVGATICEVPSSAVPGARFCWAVTSCKRTGTGKVWMSDNITHTSKPHSRLGCVHSSPCGL